MDKYLGIAAIFRGYVDMDTDTDSVSYGRYGKNASRLRSHNLQVILTTAKYTVSQNKFTLFCDIFVRFYPILLIFGKKKI